MFVEIWPMGGAGGQVVRRRGGRRDRLAQVDLEGFRGIFVSGGVNSGGSGLVMSY